MGCDGGSIPKRGELVKTKKAAEKPDAVAQTLATWFFCALSKRPLQCPVVACGFGRLYNKSAVLEFLLDPSKYGDGDVVCSHISCMKDVTTLKLTSNPAFSASTQNTSAILGSFNDQAMIPQFCCPVTQREMNGKSKFVYMELCGCVLSEQALREVSSTTCLVCNGLVLPEHILSLNPTTPEEVSAAFLRVKKLREQSAERKRSKKAEKEAKKSAKRGLKSDAEVSNGQPKTSGSGSNDDDTEQKCKKDKKRGLHSSVTEDQYISNVSAPKRINKIAQNINMTLPDLMHLSATAKPASDAIKSLYVKRDKDGKSLEDQGNFLVRGTFNRYATGF
ncbi:hypothetical protein BASA61_006994 [Batrachochytrium salamandrivorans]|nr:hypothetical protein BASA61_006994 [Batrachochytrium salamandrivorans]KAH9254935.1 hypothetical protein BASA81_007002 [Batrachochytrium salamandrivorans]KAH9265570.1 hypothetical protein BASA84_001574 [Batrachochytrium salamandrivorans]KAH9275886.1 hypothetical protein BASA83_001692 [Batrachochytrium salamandrivorans]KAJ1336942.1 hypothetical protein BSLG_006702 [Batrachochytrium salamandrivorans]